MELNPHIMQELRLQNVTNLKDSLPLYPIVRRQEESKSIVFGTLVRKKYDGIYYLIPMKFKAETEAKAIHGLHANVYKYLILGVPHFLEVEDSNQENEVIRLTKNI